MACEARPNTVYREASQSSRVAAPAMPRSQMRSLETVIPNSFQGSCGSTPFTEPGSAPYRSVTAACRMTRTPRVAMTCPSGDDVRSGRMMSRWIDAPRRAKYRGERDTR
jgi:hypothetical protein